MYANGATATFNIHIEADDPNWINPGFSGTVIVVDRPHVKIQLVKHKDQTLEAIINANFQGHSGNAISIRGPIREQDSPVLRAQVRFNVPQVSLYVEDELIASASIDSPDSGAGSNVTTH